MIEIWKDIEGYEESYQISNLGQVKSLDRMVWNGQSYWKMKGRLLKLSDDKDGYLIVGLHLNGNTKMFKVHRLVAIHFIPNPNNLPEVNHKEGNKKDNRYSMLEWCTRKDNAIHAIKTGLKVIKKGKDNPLYGKYVGELNPRYGKRHSKETLIKMSISQKEYIKKNGSYWKGKHPTDETRKKLSDATSGSNNPNARRVVCITTGETFDYIALGGEKYKVDGSSISACCRRKQKSAGKHPITGEKLVWEYI